MQKQDLKISKRQEKQSGITLVTLVITVVVMLILAGVAIAAVVDGDGLFSKTREAAETYENAADKEGDVLENLMGQIDYYIKDNENGGDDLVEDNPVVKPTATLGTKVTENQTFDGRIKGTYNNPIIPKGFAPINENGADWGTEEGYQKGLVITDEITGTESTGNEFVWIPVDGTTVKFERQDWKNAEGELLTYPENTLIGNVETTEYTETVPAEIIQSVNNNGGFYIARFEAGLPEEVSSSSVVTDGSVKPVSKQSMTVWNGIAWSENGINNNNNPGNGAVTVARSMYPDNPDSEYGAVSTLIYGTQWDTALNFIGAYNVGEDGYDTYAIDSTGMGNYGGNEDIITGLGNCGADEAFRQKNIYDMAGNVYEVTMEAYTTYCVIRGGDYNNSVSISPASFRTISELNATTETHGFRVALYIK